MPTWLHGIQRNIETPCRIPPGGDFRWAQYREETLALIRRWRQGYDVAVPFHEFVRPLKRGLNSIRFVAICGTKGVVFRYGPTTSVDGVSVVAVTKEEGVGALVGQIEELSIADYKRTANQLFTGWPTQRMTIIQLEDGHTKIVPNM